MDTFTPSSPSGNRARRTHRGHRPAAVVLAATLAVASTATLNVGCAGGPSQNEQAKVRWNAARGQVLQQLAEEQFEAGQLDEARKTCNQALAVTDRLPGLYLLSARIDAERNELSKASVALKVARMLNPPDSVLAEIEHASGIIAERWEQPEKAIDHHRKANELDPNEPGYLIAHAEALVSAGRSGEATSILEERVVYFEGNAAIRDALGQVYQAQGRHAEAAEMFRQATVLAPEDTDVRERLALALLQAGDPQRAALLLEKLLSDPRRAESLSLHVALGECRMARGEFAAARASFQKAVRLDESHLPAWIGVAKAALETSDLRQARLALTRARKLDRDHAGVRMLDGYVLLREGKIDAAAVEFRAAAKLDRADPMPLTMCGYCLSELGRHDEAEVYFRRAIALDPMDDFARDLMNRSQRMAEAIAATDASRID